MKAILRKDKCLAAIGERSAEVTDDSKWDEMDGNAIANLHLALADGVLSSIEEKKSAKEIWDHLARLYEARSLHNKNFLKRKLYALRMTESTSVTEHVNNLNTLFSQLTSLSCIIEPQERAEILLQSLPDSYDQVIINLTSNVLSDYLVFDDVAAAILEEENRRNNREDRQTSSRQVEALVVTRGRSMEPGSSGSHNHGKSKTGKKKNFKCFKCGKPGHFRKDCRGLNTSYPQGNVASTSEDGNALCCEAAVANESRKRFADVWLFDTGATFHMTARREWFHQYKPISGGGSVYSCNDHELKIIGIGSIMVKMHDGTVRTIRDVRHVEGLKKNLLSLGQLDDLGCKVEIQNKIMKIIKGALVLMKGEKVAANLYQLKGEIMEEAEASVDLHSPSHRVVVSWHQKLGHMSEQGMKILVERKLIPDLIKVSLPFCKYCVISKQHRLKFKTSNFRSVYVLELVHSDVWQAPVQSLGGAKYFASFIDDYSRRCWVYPIKKKSNVQEGIKRQFKTAYTPQQNGVAERMNRTLLERARAMLATVELKTPMETWTGRQVNYSDLHIFGSHVYVMYNTQETTKLDPKSIKCLFLGYADEVKRYRLWDPTAHKIEKEFQSNDSSKAVPQHEVNETDESQAPATRTLNRERRRPGWQADYVMENNVAYCLFTEEGEPSTLQEALNNPDASFWKEAMQEEIEALHKNKTWELMPLPGDRKPIGNKWVYKIKRDGDDQVERYRARLVVKGYDQKEGIDFNEIFSLVVRMTTIRVVLAMCVAYDLHLEQLHVKTLFLHGNLEEEIYMLQPEGFKQKGKENLVCRLNKSLYGLKQAPRFGNNDFIILLLYVEDMLVADPNKDRSNKLKAQLAKEFEMKDLGPANKILRIPSNEKQRMEMSQVPYASPVGTVKRILRYIKGTSDVALCFGDSDLIVKGYVDSDYAFVAMSTTEAEYVAAAQASKEVVWLKMLLEELGLAQEKITLFCDNQSALYLLRNPTFHSKTKHIRVQYHFVREKVEDGTVDMRKMHTDDNVANYLTKAIKCDKFIWCRSSCGLAKT
ncbi:retrovirus-related pol polyprotein from transposon TNT 1-94 [Tanacetum coccineum]